MCLSHTYTHTQHVYLDTQLIQQEKYTCIQTASWGGRKDLSEKRCITGAQSTLCEKRKAPTPNLVGNVGEKVGEVWKDSTVAKLLKHRIILKRLKNPKLILKQTPRYINLVLYFSD